MVCIRVDEQNACQWNETRHNPSGTRDYPEIGSAASLRDGADDSCTQSIVHPACTLIARGAANRTQKGAPSDVHDGQPGRPSLQGRPIAQVISAISHQPKKCAKPRCTLPAAARQSRKDNKHQTTEDIEEIERHSREQPRLIEHQRAEQRFVGRPHKDAEPQAVKDQKGEQGTEVGEECFPGHRRDPCRSELARDGRQR